MNTKDKITINLEDYRVIGKDGTKAKVFTGRDRGEDVRKKSNIDKLEEEYEEIHIIIPDNVYSINPSFFEELFVNVVMKLRKDKFLDKFKFETQGEYDYERPLSQAIIRILRKNTAIG
ncbi:MAG TPA: DUF4325 domain-containing protein [Arachidicoccus sp.]|nr:DUF4325 domain-containing protein [Arachidicoccus sp.]